MKSIKVFYHGKRLKDMYPYATKFEVLKYRFIRIMRKILICLISLGIASGALYGSYKAGSMLSPQIVTATERIEVPVDAPIPVLERIAQCESGNKHLNSNGQLLIKVNTDGSVDRGVMQINSVWDKKATELGYDLTKESDNRSFGLWLFKNFGSSPWSASSKCWLHGK